MGGGSLLLRLLAELGNFGEVGNSWSAAKYEACLEGGAGEIGPSCRDGIFGVSSADVCKVKS